MADREIILRTLKFIKEKGDSTNQGVNLEESEEFAQLEPKVKEQIRDKLVINQYASFPINGEQWKLSITWHPNGGVDILNSKFINWVIRPNGKLRYTYKGWGYFKEYFVTIMLSFIAGLLLFLFTDIVIKPKLQKSIPTDPINKVDTTIRETKTNSQTVTNVTSKDSVNTPQLQKK